jgi:hypothetical protein
MRILTSDLTTSGYRRVNNGQASSCHSEPKGWGPLRVELFSNCRGPCTRFANFGRLPPPPAHKLTRLSPPTLLGDHRNRLAPDAFPVDLVVCHLPPSLTHAAYLRFQTAVIPYNRAMHGQQEVQTTLEQTHSEAEHHMDGAGWRAWPSQSGLEDPAGACAARFLNFWFLKFLDASRCALSGKRPWAVSK